MNELEVEQEDALDPPVDRSVRLQIRIIEHALDSETERSEVRSSLTWHARALVRNGKRYKVWELCFDTILLTRR